MQRKNWVGWRVLCIVALSFLSAGAAWAASDMQAAIATVQAQIQSVQQNVKQQLVQQSAANQHALSDLQVSLQKQITTLHQQIQQVDNNLMLQLQRMQKEINELAMIR